MGPIKDADLIKCVRDNNRTKFLKYVAEKALGSVSKSGVKEDPSVPGGRIRLKLNHMNVNCHEPSTGYTLMIIAVLNGNKDLVEDLIFHSASVDSQDGKGNTALHMAVFGAKMEIVDLLLHNRAKVNVQNSDGNSPLHIACQLDKDRVHMLLKLLSNNADYSLRNKDNKTALDMAAMFNKADAVSVLLDHDHGIEESKRVSRTSNTVVMIEAAKRGYKEVIELLLDYGYDPNQLHKEQDTYALMEAVRFVRLPVVDSLLKYGAKPGLKNSKNESAENLVSACVPKQLEEQFIQTFAKYRSSGALQTPRFLKVLSKGMSLQGLREYPALPNNKSWTENSEEFCNSCTPNGPNTNILDDDLCTCWLAAEIHQAWTVLDLKHEHTLTGITIYGWDSPQMVRAFELQKGQTLHGPWSTVVPCTCLRTGSTSLADPGVPQTFTDFTSRSRYWRILLLDNFGGKCTCFQGIQLYGADERIRSLLKENDMDNYADEIISSGFNTYKKFLLMKEDDLKQVVSEVAHRTLIMKSLEKDRPKEFHPAVLSWEVTPFTSAKQGEVLPDFVVKSAPGVKTLVRLVIENGAVLQGDTEVLLLSDSETEPSRAVFTNISIDTVGNHILKVECVEYPRVYLTTPQPINIKPKTVLRDSVALAFDDMEAMLKDLSASLGPANK
ncbi:ankyrin repeat and sterile alpha motif domain-containing protein 1B-like [Dreissena polymorpha]|uniref:F5/8 type C domain-containing protein n=1 Tax=Dreissena polymorpha TaxID=45954 RepID=A0A9D4GFU2_DREPO|nr:ankyrin repeat and sterile alpha motif domain-containing protein 1B-like [Dreissena polymorpha]KAH3816102.1 hypothetical protein DPMN_117610 [Dreissena polymorpha]